MNSLLCEKSFQRYAQLIHRLIPGASGIALYDAKAHSVQSFGFATAAEIPSLPTELFDLKGHAPIGAAREIALPGGSDLYLVPAPILNSAGAAIGTLGVLFPRNPGPGLESTPLGYAAECIGTEISLNQELDAMTHELSERYEELNLVYHTEDQVNYFREGRDALTTLTQNCLDYLDVGMSMLILESKNVAIFCSNSQEPITDQQVVKSVLSDAFYTQVTDQRLSIVINDMTDPMAITLLPGFPFKVLACPILNNNNEGIGLLATVNDYASNNFSNSDRNLLQVMSRKAAKIIAANYDSLTGLINRNGYEYFLETALADANNINSEKCMLHINIDQLHVVNDTLGHAAGDKAIRRVAEIVGHQKRDYDTLSRIGGDEFGLLLHDCSAGDATELGARICRAVAASTLEHEENSYNVTVSIGVAALGPHTPSPTQIMGYAELACALAKEEGQNQVRTYHIDDAEIVSRGEQMHMVAEIQSALVENRFTLYCQPIHPLNPADRSHHTEVLIRLINDKGEVTTPNTFIPAAERYHLMPAVDRWVVRNALSMLSSFDGASLLEGVYAINLSGQSFTDPGFFDYVDANFEEFGVPPECICFEITETAAVANLERAVKFISQLKKLGCKFSLDDFGSGASSFGYLKRLPVDYLKIDGFIVKDVTTDHVASSMVAAINNVGHSMNLLTIAEYVENEAIRMHLEKLGVDYVQGYAIGRPEPFLGRLQHLMSRPALVAS